MKITILSIFPEFFDSFLNWSMINRAIQGEKVEFNNINIRDYSKNKHKKVDDYPFGGGPGMLMTPGPLIEAIKDNSSNKTKVIYLSPQGKVLNQEMVKKIAMEEDLILLSGHYEGIDNRVIENYIDLEISIGDYVLTGGELPSMVLIDSIIRMIPGVLKSSESIEDESHYNGLLEHPQYTRPSEYKGLKVPEVLLSGHHKNIQDWKRKMAIKTTFEKRPDLINEDELSEDELSEDELKYLKELKSCK